MNEDRTTVHIVVIFIGIIALGLAGGMLLLNLNSQNIDPTLNTLGGTAVGSLVTLLTSTRAKGSDSTAVTVTNPDPIPVTDTPSDNTPAKHAATDEPVGADLPVNDLTG